VPEHERPVLKERAKQFALVILAVFLVLWGRLWQLQVVRGDSFETLAEVNRVRTVPIRAPRGAIYDARGRVIAANRLAFTVSVVPSGLQDPDGSVVARLSELLEMEPGEIIDLVRRGGEYPYTPIRLKRDVPIETAVAIEEARSSLPGVLVEEEWVREYPYGPLGGHLIGYLGLADRSDLQAGYRPTDLVGKAGLEQAFEHFLRGADGERRVEVNALSRPTRELEIVPPRPGMDLYLTLDLEFQQVVEEALKRGLERMAAQAEHGLAGKGAAVVLDAKTGGILALASFPAIDPARLTGEDRSSYVEELNQDPMSPWLNRALRAFPPGSTFKVVTGIAALESGAIGPDEVYNAVGYHKYGKRDWTVRSGLPPAGPITIVEAFGRSTNDFFWEIALRPQTGGIEGIARWAQRLGLGGPTGIELAAAEMHGLIPTPEWKRQVYRQPWYEAETMDVAIGQGFLQVTPLQMARLYLVVATEGLLRPVHLVHHVEAPDGSVSVDLRGDQGERVPAKASTWRALKEGLRHVLQWPRGTAYSAFAGAEYDPAGKTGTAQTETAAHGWFAGFAPAHDPEIVVVVFAEHGESGVEAARVAREIMDWYFDPHREQPGPENARNGQEIGISG